MDDYLPIYARILDDVCPIPTDSFPDAFDSRFARLSHKEGKTAWNHRTENAGKLLGMYYEKDGVIHITQRTRVFLETNDQPAFFKSVCFKFQQPNGSQKIQTIKEKVRHKIRFKPYHFVIKLLKLASENNVVLTKDEIAYYVLNCLETLQGKISPQTAFDRIKKDRETNSHKERGFINEDVKTQFVLLELANLVRIRDKSIILNRKEAQTINLFEEELKATLRFDVTVFDLSAKYAQKTISLAWQEYYASISNFEFSRFYTTLDALDIPFYTDLELREPLGRKSPLPQNQSKVQA